MIKKRLFFFIAASLSMAIVVGLLLFDESTPFQIGKPSVTDVKRAEPAAKLPRIGLLTCCDVAFNKMRSEGLRQALQEYGYIEGKNFVLEIRNGSWRAGQAKANEPDFEQLDELAKELVSLEVDVIVTFNTETALSLQRATKTIPIVMLSTDPVRAGLVQSYAQPGANITGVASGSSALNWKRLELLREISPNTSVVGILQDITSEDAGVSAQMKNARAGAEALGLRLVVREVQGDDYESAFAEVKRRGADSLLMLTSNKQMTIYPRIVELAAKSRLPAVYPSSVAVDAGGLISYAFDRAYTSRRVAYFVDRILKGAKPADLPVDMPTKFELVINLTAAKQIGLTIPESVLHRADRIIPDK